MITEPTSHFIGLSIISEVFQPLFDRLSLYIKSFDIGDSIELQRLESIHITLYYLGDSISETEMKLYEQFHRDNMQDFHSIGIQEIDYFYGDTGPCILYLVPINTEKFSHMNEECTSLFQGRDIPDNLFPYVPHITLIRIRDSDIFALHRESIEKIIQEFTGGISDILLISTLALYAVDSGIRPELQERIL